MEGENPQGKPISKKRQKILDMAFAQLRKSRAAMDPQVLSKIRRIVAGSPELMKKLGLTEKLTPKRDESMPLSKKVDMRKRQEEPIVEPKIDNAVKPKIRDDGYEEVDQAKNMEVMAKLMALNPEGRDLIKAAIKKASD